jgi:hypothetical protein
MPKQEATNNQMIVAIVSAPTLDLARGLVHGIAKHIDDAIARVRGRLVVEILIIGADLSAMIDAVIMEAIADIISAAIAQDHTLTLLHAPAVARLAETLLVTANAVDRLHLIAIVVRATQKTKTSLPPPSPLIMLAKSTMRI